MSSLFDPISFHAIVLMVFLYIPPKYNKCTPKFQYTSVLFQLKIISSKLEVRCFLTYTNSWKTKIPMWDLQSILPLIVKRKKERKERNDLEHWLFIWPLFSSCFCLLFLRVPSGSKTQVCGYHGEHNEPPTAASTFLWILVLFKFLTQFIHQHVGTFFLSLDYVGV